MLLRNEEIKKHRIPRLANCKIGFAWYQPAARMMDGWRWRSERQIEISETSLLLSRNFLPIFLETRWIWI
jgi:hypothetical protein